jgi:hypothetical protein
VSLAPLIGCNTGTLNKLVAGGDRASFYGNGSVEEEFICDDRYLATPRADIWIPRRRGSVCREQEIDKARLVGGYCS